LILNRFTILELAGASLNGKVDAFDNYLSTTIGQFQNLKEKFEGLEDEVAEIGRELVR
jgi:hypothetical protein